MNVNVSNRVQDGVNNFPDSIHPASMLEEGNRAADTETLPRGFQRELYPVLT
jgi:hypothetical protein